MSEKMEMVTIDLPYSFASCAKGILTVVVMFTIVVMLGYNIESNSIVSNPVILVGAGVATIAMFISIFRIVLKLYFTQREIREGLSVSYHIEDKIFKGSKDIVLSDNGFVEFKQSFLEKFFDIGNIVIQDISGRLIEIREIGDFTNVMSQLVKHPIPNKKTAR